MKDESIAHCAKARSAADIHVRCDVSKMCDWRIWQSIFETSSDILVLDTRDIVQKYVIDNVYRIEINTYNSILKRTMDNNVVVWAVYAFGELTASLN